MADAYVTRLLAYTEGKDPLAMQREMPKLLAQLVKGASREKLHQRPAPGKWSVAEILAHLAENEIPASWRYRQILENSGGPLSSYDQDTWAALGDYHARQPAESLELFRLLRESNLLLFGRLTPEQWQCYGVHAERGRFTVQEYARMVAGHDRNHLEQIQKILQ